MKRLLTLATALLAAGILATACSVVPPAATVNGRTISTSAFNAQLRAFDGSTAGQCLLMLQNGQSGALVTQGTGGPGTYDMAFADFVLDNSVGNLMADLYATSRGLTVTSADLASAKKSFESTLDGEIGSAVQQSVQSGAGSACLQSNGQALTGAQLLAGLPAAVGDGLVRNQAVDEKILADGADLSSQAIDAYYAANPSLFTVDCVSVIVTDTQAHANQLIAQINGGASFAAVAKASSLDSQTAPSGGSLGCSNTQARVEQALQLQSIPVGKPLAPIQDPSSGAWFVYEVTSQTTEPVAAATPLIRQALLQQTANVNRANREVVAFAQRATVSIDPRYGTWNQHRIVAPVAPPARYLLAGVSGQPLPSSNSSVNLGGGLGGSGGTGSTGPTTGG